MKKYLLITFIIIICSLSVLTQSVLWSNNIKSWINQNLSMYGWSFNAKEYSGSLLSTIILKDIEFKSQAGSIIEIERTAINLGIISTIFNEMVFDLLTIEGMHYKYFKSETSKSSFSNNNPNFSIPFHIKSFFIDSKVTTNINEKIYVFDAMVGGELQGMDSPNLNFDLVKISSENNTDLVCKLNNMQLGYDNESYFLRNLDGEVFNLPIKGNISIKKKNSFLEGKINVDKFSFPEELFSKLPLQTKFSTFRGEFNFESDFQYFEGKIRLENQLGLEMLGNFHFTRNEKIWHIKQLELKGENSELTVNGLWNENEKISAYMNLENLDLSRWIKNQKATDMSGLFILDASLTNIGALDQIDITMEIIESKLFNQGEISVHGQFSYQDSILTTVEPVMLLVGDSYLTVDGNGDFESKTINFFSDMEKADIDLINNFLPRNFISGKATGKMRVKGNFYSPSVASELFCENIIVDDFNLNSIELNSQISVEDNMSSGFIDIKADNGTWRDRSFESATLSAVIENKSIKIENCHFKSGKDFLQASGIYDGINNYNIERFQLAYNDNYLINTKPLNFLFRDEKLEFQPFELHINDGIMEGVITGGAKPEARFKMSNFDAEVITQFLKDDRLKISGLIFGEIWIQSDGKYYDLDTEISLKKGRYMKEDFDEMIISCLYKNGILHIDDISMTKKGLMGLQVAGTVPIRKKKIGNSRISLNSNFSNLPLKFFHRYFPEFFDVSGLGTGNIKIYGSPNQTNFNYNLKVNNASFDLIDLYTFSSQGNYDGKRLYVKSAKSENQEEKINAWGTVPFDLNIGSPKFGKLYPNDSISFSANANLKTLPFLSPYINELDSAKGDFEIKLSLTGQSKNIMRNGYIKVKDGLLYTLLFSNPITNIDGMAIISDNQLTINNFDLILFHSDDNDSRPSKQNTFITGRMNFNKFFNPEYDLKIKAKNATYKLLFLDISGNSNLDLNIVGRDTVLIDGVIETQEAKIFYEFTTEDIGEPIQNQEGSILAYNLNIPIIGKANFKNSQIDASVTGELNLSQIGNQEVDFGGQIIVEDGSVFSYKDYFNKLNGIISFDNKGFNPNIDVSAFTMIDDERIDLRITGGIENLDIILESASGFSESDILELLTWGRRFEDNDLTTTGFGNQTVSILGTLLENQLEKNLKESNIGVMNYVDDIDISGAAGLLQGANEDFQVTTKTQISDKTFLNLSYKRSFSLNQDQSKVGVEYKLNRHFSVVGNVDEEGNLNLKYRYRYAY